MKLIKAKFHNSHTIYSLKRKSDFYHFNDLMISWLACILTLLRKFVIQNLKKSLFYDKTKGIGLHLLCMNNYCPAFFSMQVFSIWITLFSGATAELTCDTLLLLSTNLTGESVLFHHMCSDLSITISIPFQTLLCDIWLIMVILLYVRAKIWSNLKFQGLTLMSILTHLNISIKDTGLSFWIKATQLGFFNPSQNVKHKMLPKMLGLCVMEQTDGCQYRFYLMFLL